MKVAVLGAGVVGVSTAWFLAEHGHEVVVVDRASGAGRETSFANGGQISVSQSEPWAKPSAPFKALKWLLKEDAPLLFRLRLDPAQWRWGLQFLWECRRSRVHHNMVQMLNLGKFSRETFIALREQTGIDYQQLSRGIVTLLWSQQEVDEAAHTAAVMQQFGVNKRLITIEELAALEPALAGLAPRLAGATFCEDDESGNVHLFTSRLADMAAARGVEFCYGTRINALEHDGEQIGAISVTRPDGAFDSLKADAYVLALGSYSPLLARPLGLALPVYPLKGYSATLPLQDASAAPMVSITDEEHKIFISRLGDSLRIAGTAELNGYSTALNAVRCQALIRHGKMLFADACRWNEARFWTGLRPATPGNVPLIGRTRYRNLYLNTGHGTLGWTEGPGSGRALAAIISGQRPPVEFAFTGV